MTALVEPFRVAPQRPARYSMSYLRAATQCLRRAHHDREEDSTGADAIIGRVFHEIADAIGFATVMGGHQTPDYVLAERIALRVLSKPAEINPLSRHVREEVLMLLGRWLTTAMFESGEMFETSMRHEIRGRVVSARIDRLWIDHEHQEAWVRDYKTGRADPPQRPEPTPQGDIYAWQILQEYPWLNGVWFAQEHVRFGHPPLPFFYTLDAIAEIDAWLYDMVGLVDAAYDAGDLPPNPGEACSMWDGCPVADSCPVKQWARPATVLRDPAAALAEFAALMAEEQSIDARRAAIRSWVDRETLLQLVADDDAAVEQFATLMVEEGSAAVRKKRLRGWLSHSAQRAVQLNGQEIGYGTDASETTDWKALAALAEFDDAAIAAHTRPKNPSFARRRAK